MTGRERQAAACLLPSFPGARAPDWVRRFVADGGGGIVLFADNVPEHGALRALCEELRGERGDVLLALDEEGGDVTRLHWREGSPHPSAAALGVVDDVGATERVAGAVADELALAGVNWNLAPVADVNRPDNPVIGTRSFGGDEKLVARHVAAHVRATQRRGVAACAKHFPGHGATAEDSHRELPTVQGDPLAGLPPFRAAIDAGVRSIMTAHVRLPGYGDEPATLNRRVVHELLRAELGYEGVVVADALEMKGVSAGVGLEEAAARAIAAGVDALCVGHDVGEGAVAAIRAALAARVDESRLAEAAERVRRLARWAAQPTPAGAVDDTARAVARRALLVEGDLSFRSPPRVVELRPQANIAAGEPADALAPIVVREREPVPEADVYLVRDAHRHPWIREAADRRGAVVVELGLPVWRPAAARGYVATYGGGRVALDALADVLALVPA
ncbi:MAG TPA: glycoside hydrolase family 3 N-terminal domain-containing protein [Gaiellaceae bacterium]|nr:glycoside hydrolase family 3 N-terminal domain-containing protein [Gaiellaceae bacterium]